MGNIDVTPNLGIKKAQLVGTIKRANGHIEHLGVISQTDYTPKSIFKRLGEKLCLVR